MERDQATKLMQGLLKKLVEIQYERGDYDFARGHFRVRGDVLMFPESSDSNFLRYSIADVFRPMQCVRNPPA